MEKFKNNKVYAFLIVGIIITLIAGLGSTYAFFIYRNTGSNISLEAGDISVSFVNGKNYLNVEKSYPISDAVGMISPYYNDFTIEGTTNDVDIKYEIQIVPNTNNTIDTQYIKVYLTDQSDNKITDVAYYNDLSDASYNENGKNVYTSYMTENDTKDFRLRVWIDESYIETTAQDFGFTIYLYAVNEEVSTVYLYNIVLETLALTEQDADGTSYVTGNNITVASQTSNKLTGIKGNNLVNELDNDINLATIDTTEDVNNYVWYSGKLWRIVAINSDGSIKLVTQGNISAVAWSVSSTDTNYATSQIHSWLNNEFVNTLVNANDLLVDIAWDYTTYNSFPTEKLTATSTVSNEKVGLLNIYDFMMTGGTTSSSTTSTFLNNNYHWWTMSPRYDSSKVWNVDYSGVAGTMEPSYSRGIRPTIVLRKDISLIGEGDGTKNNPYLIDDNQGFGVASELISNRISGEYINFNNVLYRIVGTEVINGKKLTKVTMADYSINNNSIAASQKFGSSSSEITFSPTYGIGLYLNEWYNADSTSETYASVYIADNYKAMIATNQEDGVVWYVGPDSTGVGNDYTLSKTESTISSTIGLGYYGEIFAGQYGDGRTTSNHIWLMTKYSDTQNWFILSYGNGNYGDQTNGYAVRPFFYLKSDVKIGDVDGDGSVGTGLPSAPYEIIQ